MGDTCREGGQRRGVSPTSASLEHSAASLPATVQSPSHETWWYITYAGSRVDTRAISGLVGYFYTQKKKEPQFKTQATVPEELLRDPSAPQHQEVARAEAVSGLPSENSSQPGLLVFSSELSCLCPQLLAPLGASGGQVHLMSSVRCTDGPWGRQVGLIGQAHGLGPAERLPLAPPHLVQPVPCGLCPWCLSIPVSSRRGHSSLCSSVGCTV